MPPARHMHGFIVTGTDTGVGKTIFAAGLAGALDAFYWKPVQSGLDGETDAETVRRLSGLLPERILSEAYRLTMPASPHRAAEAEELVIDVAKLTRPSVDGPLIIEGAGGPMVPLTRRRLLIDVFADWGLPVIVCARTSLGTINHTLLAVEALKRRAIPVHGVAFIGEANEDTEMTIAEFAGVRRLGRLPPIADLSQRALATAFKAAFEIGDFQ